MRSNENARGLLRLLKKEKWYDVATHFYDDGEVTGADKIALAEYFLDVSNRHVGRSSEPTNWEQERMQWARYFFHKVRLLFLNEQKRKRLSPTIRAYLAKLVVHEANEEYRRMDQPLTVAKLIGPTDADRNFPADRPAPKRVGHIFGTDYEPHARNIITVILKKLRFYVSKRKI